MFGYPDETLSLVSDILLNIRVSKLKLKDKEFILGFFSSDDSKLIEFNKADTDQDGFVTPEEVKHYLETGLKKKKTYSLQWVTDWMKRMDRDGDGKYNYEG